jgi:two-component system, OmpR family, copper resistance phosphate regulon response regulator CusR
MFREVPQRLSRPREESSRPQSPGSREQARRDAGADSDGPTPGRILIIDDEDRILQFVARGLRAEGYEVDLAADPHEGLEAALSDGYDLVILDLLMPRLPGITVLDRIIQRRPQQVVIVLSCLTDTRTKVQCFQLGADDYVAKPFSFHELLERVRARIRTARLGAGPLVVGSLRVDLVHRQVHAGSRPIALTEREFLLLWELIRNPGQTVSKEHLLSAVWGYNFDPGSNVIDVYVARLRQKLGPEAIVTVRGEGYRLNAA